VSLDTSISLTTLDEVKAFLGEDVKRDGLWVYSNAAGATAATVEVTDTTMVLIITGGGSAGTTTLTFADANKDTIAELVVAINAVSGWKSGRICHGDAASTDLVVTGALSCLGADNEITLSIIDNYLLTQLINRASDMMNRYCSRILKTTTYTKEVYYGTGYDKLILEQFPVTRVSRVSVGRATSFRIKNTSADATVCTVEISTTAMRLVVTGGANADDTTLTLADYANIDLLIAAIEALGKGWECTKLATDTATRLATELLPRPAMAVTPTVSAECETPDDDLTDYRLLNPTEARNEGMLLRASAFDATREYFVSYTAGYTTIPYSLEMFCIYLVSYIYGKSKRAGTEGLQSESFGEGADYSYTRQRWPTLKRRGR